MHLTTCTLSTITTSLSQGNIIFESALFRIRPHPLMTFAAIRRGTLNLNPAGIRKIGHAALREDHPPVALGPLPSDTASHSLTQILELELMQSMEQRNTPGCSRRFMLVRNTKQSIQVEWHNGIITASAANSRTIPSANSPSPPTQHLDDIQLGEGMNWLVHLPQS